MAFEKSLIFWEDDHTEVLHLSTGRIVDIGDVKEIFIETKELNAARAWYNSNLLIEDYMPKIFPLFRQADETEDECVERTFEEYFCRIRQRNEGKGSPKKPQIEVFHGLMKFDSDGDIAEVYVRNALGNMMKIIPDVSNHAMQVIERDGFAFWDGTHYV